MTLLPPPAVRREMLADLHYRLARVEELACTAGELAVAAAAVPGAAARAGAARALREYRAGAAAVLADARRFLRVPALALPRRLPSGWEGGKKSRVDGKKSGAGGDFDAAALDFLEQMQAACRGLEDALRAAGTGDGNDDATFRDIAG